MLKAAHKAAVWFGWAGGTLVWWLLVIAPGVTIPRLVLGVAASVTTFNAVLFALRGTGDDEDR